MSTRWFVGDVETTSDKPDAKVCEIAWAEIDEDSLQVLDRQHSLIDPQVRITAAASGVHNITNLDTADAPTMDEFFEIIYGKRLDGICVLIAHNVSFDRPFFEPYIDNLAGVICTLRLSRRYFPEVDNHRLQTLKYALNLVKGNSHSADGDVEMTVDLVRKLVERSGLPLAGLMAEGLKPIAVEIMPFGKHKGMAVRDLPSGYRQWLLTKCDNLDSDLRWSVEQVGK